MLRESLVFLGLSLAALAACGDDASSTSGRGGGSATTATSGGEGAGGSSATTGPLTCDAGTHEEEGRCVPTFLGWAQGDSMGIKRVGHAAFAAETPSGTYLYAVAGRSLLDNVDSIERATLGADGTPSAFEAMAEPFPITAGLVGVAQWGRTVLMVGGFRDAYGAASAGAHLVRITDSGGLTFEEAPELTGSRTLMAVTSTATHAYVIGGYAEGSDSETALVQRASFDGTNLGAWENLAPLDAPLSRAAAVVHGDGLFLVGGAGAFTNGPQLYETPAETRILRAAIADDGGLGPFVEVGNLPEGRHSASAFVYLDHLHVVGGEAMILGEPRATLLRAPIEDDGTVGAFVELAPLPKVRSASPLAQLGRWVYSVGGDDATGSTYDIQSELFFGRFE